MKKHMFTIALVSCSLVYFISCSDKDDTTTTGTCSDGIKNQTETAVDCGGTCAACPTCTDGVKNGTETGVDCGGTCTACVSCSDNIQNQGETGVDCGGPCPACPVSCSDGIKNQSETQIDCGGPNCPPCPTATMTCQVNSVNWAATATGFPTIVHNGGIYVLSGVQLANNTTINITLGTAPHTNSISLDNFNATYLISGTTNWGGSGTLDITTWNQTTHRVSGTFFFLTNGTIPYDITSGTFTNVYYN